MQIKHWLGKQITQTEIPVDEFLEAVGELSNHYDVMITHLHTGELFIFVDDKGKHFATM